MISAEGISHASAADVAALCRLLQSQNLVPGARVHAQTITIAANDAQNRTRLPLREWRREHTRAFAVILKVRAQLTAEANAYVVFFAINARGKETATLTQLAAAAGQWIAHGAAAEHALPAWMDEAWIDVAALRAADFSTRSAGIVSLVVYEMVPAVLCGAECVE